MAPVADIILIGYYCVVKCLYSFMLEDGRLFFPKCKKSCTDRYLTVLGLSMNLPFLPPRSPRRVFQVGSEDVDFFAPFPLPLVMFCSFCSFLALLVITNSCLREFP